MKAPSKSISRSLRGQTDGVGRAETVSTSGLKQANAASMTIPGDGNVCEPPGAVSPASSKAYANAVGGHFGGAGQN